MKQSRTCKLAQFFLIPFVLLLAGCSSSEVKMVDVPRKDIPPDMYNKPIPPEAFKHMAPAARKQLKKAEEQIKNSKRE
jgi:hypothetical protein